MSRFRVIPDKRCTSYSVKPKSHPGGVFVVSLLWMNAAWYGLVEVVGYGFNRSPTTLTKHNTRKFNRPFFPIHPLIHTCCISREVFRSVYESCLPANLRCFARGLNWVITGNHCQDFQKITNNIARPPNPWDLLHFIRRTKVNTQNVAHYWLNFDGSKDIFLHSTYLDIPYLPCVWKTVLQLRAHVSSI